MERQLGENCGLFLGLNSVYTRMGKPNNHRYTCFMSLVPDPKEQIYSRSQKKPFREGDRVTARVSKPPIKAGMVGTIQRVFMSAIDRYIVSTLAAYGPRLAPGLDHTRPRMRPSMSIRRTLPGASPRISFG